MKRLSWLKARKLKKLGYFKLPKTGHPWIGSPYTWARIVEGRRVTPYTENYLAAHPIETLTLYDMYNVMKQEDKFLSNDRFD
ncbi:hypothetical protein ABNF65_21370 [Paenibacillus larvae]